jgi:ribonucleoside-diphosphate reductase alpha chain
MSQPAAGPKNPFSLQLLDEKYALTHGETYRDMCCRLAANLHDSEAHRRRLLDILLGQEFSFAGRIMAAIGSPKAVTPFNCYVSGTIEDSMVEGNGSIYHRLHQAAATMRMGGGIGYDWSTLRPSGDLIRGVMSKTDGPLAFMPVFDATCKATSSAGNRRGAQMGVMRVDHPDIERFITAKHTPGVLSGFNLSVAVTDEFMQAVEHDGSFDLKFDGRIYKTIKARPLWELIMRSAWDYAEPGVLFIDTINRMNNLWYCETIAATNPCGEQPLPPFGACLLGSFLLTSFIRNGGTDQVYFDYDRLREIVGDVVRAVDNVIDQAIFPLPEQEAEAKAKRRMGLGITGFANAVEALGHKYGSDGAQAFVRKVMSIIRDEAYHASALLASEKGAFPMFDAEKYLQGDFIRRLPAHIRKSIEVRGIRNSHLLSIAPTGTMSLVFDNISSGIEPVFAYEGQRIAKMEDGDQLVDVDDFAYANWGVKGKLSKDVTAMEHVEMLAEATFYVDSAVSKTCNVDGSMAWDDFKELYMTAWRLGCKGCTVYNRDGKLAGILMEKPKAETEAEAVSTTMCYIDPETGAKECG